MRNSALLLLLSLLLLSCSSKIAKEKNYVDAIKAIENGLVDGVLIEGETPNFYSIQERMEHHKIPGVSIAFFEEGEIKWTKVYGYADKENTRPVDVNTLFQAASISKPVAASGAMKLVENGEIDLDTDINEYLSDWKVEENKFTTEEKVTLRRLVTHNAGLTVHGFRGYASDEEVPSTTQVLKGVKPANSDVIRPDTFPGAIQRYSGGGYTVMQKMMEEKTGGNIADYLQKTVLDKAGMKNSTYKQPLPDNMRKNASFGYKGDGSLVKGNWHTYPEQAAAGLWTTPSDLARFAISMQNAYKGSQDEFIGSEMAQKIIKEQIPGQGLGPAIISHGDTLWFGHGGANEGFRCQLFANARMLHGQGVAIMTNSDRGSALVGEILQSMSAYYKWDISKRTKKMVIDMAEADFEKFVGTYAYTDKYKIEITKLGNGHLQVKNLWSDWIYQLRPEGPLAFFATNYGNQLSFKQDEDGKIISVSEGSDTAKKIK